MKYTATAIIKDKITAQIDLNNQVSATVLFATDTPTGELLTVIDGGEPDTIYPIVVIDGGSL
jgi:hypothetical protein